MAVNLSPLGGAGAQFFSNNGVPLAGGLLYTYLAGTSTPATTFTSSSGLTALATMIIQFHRGSSDGSQKKTNIMTRNYSNN
jgi:hypothetical protein